MPGWELVRRRLEVEDWRLEIGDDMDNDSPSAVQGRNQYVHSASDVLPCNQKTLVRGMPGIATGKRRSLGGKSTDNEFSSAYGGEARGDCSDEEKPVEEKAVEAPVEPKAAEEKPVEAPVETKPVEEAPAGTKAVGEKPAETKPAETKPVRQSPWKRSLSRAPLRSSPRRSLQPRLRLQRRSVSRRPSRLASP
ncbi:hypothetical protein BKA56DRAFT_624049 [Ilyonectria sp. MPI-CAGE-AT-0026]|nr:hypothetical protein BKA56DRAFT_624049 [Ilyonectria sp. MPI-CAGE-AT-0026]